MDKRGAFSSKFGVVAAVGGSVVGLGNIWRFPYLAGENGGAAFLLIYILVCLLISVPLLITELAIGRAGRKDVVNTYRILSGGRKWEFAGILCVIASFLLISFYSVLGGWSLKFLASSIVNEYSGAGKSEVATAFKSFVQSGWEPVMWTILFVVMNGIVVYKGVEKGIEKFSKTVMPIIILTLIIMVIFSFNMSGFKESMAFLFKPDFSKITPDVVMKALGQSFFSLSIGIGSIITYGSYVKKNKNLVELSGIISVTDISVALLSGLAIFPAVFTMGISPTSGPDLVFVTLPLVFNSIPYGYILSVIFGVLLFVAAITSSISLLEVQISYLVDEHKFKRKISAIAIVVISLICASITALSQVHGSNLTLFGYNLFDVFDYATGNVLLPLGGLFSALFVGWFLDKKVFYNQITNHGRQNLKFYPLLRFLVRYVLPIVVSVLLFTQLGLI